MKILLVDDDTIQIESLKIGLTARGYEVHGELSADSALVTIERESFDMVLTDYYMPGTDGIDLLKQVRKKSAALPVVMMTGYADKKLVLDALHNRCDALIEKPFALNDLVAVIEKVISEKSVNTDLVKLGDSLHESTPNELLNKTYDLLDTLDTLLEICANDLPLNELLDNLTRHVLNTPRLCETGQGGLFLADKESQILKMEISRYFPESIKKHCSKVLPNSCFCGCAQREQEIKFCRCDSEENLNINIPAGEVSWHNYCVPIVHREKTLGMLVVLVSKDHVESALERKFLNSVSKIMASIIHRKQTEEEKERIETTLRHAQKMHAIGSFIGGIAHDFNNMIQVILGFSQLTLLNMPMDSPYYEKIKEIELTAQKARNLTRHLLSFGRKIDTDYKLTDINQLISKTENLLSRMLPKKIRIKLLLSPELRPICVDPNQIEQVIVNLCLNARDAMPEGGTVRIETERIFLDDSFCKIHPACSPGEYILLSVSDHGIGIDEQTMDRMYEPFFTTKDIGEGTGLGLSIVYRIIKNHDGHIVCYSEAGVGTTFKIYLPARRNHGDEEDYDEGEIKLEGNEKILLVDDEESLLKITSGILNTFGYKTYTASDGQQALEIFKKKKDKIDLIILDLLMPGMDGAKCLNSMLNISPDAKILVASGYTIGNTMRKLLRLGAKGVIRKPFEIKQMLKAVRNVLDGNQIHLGNPDSPLQPLYRSGSKPEDIAYESL